MWLLPLAHAAPELNVILVSSTAREVTVASQKREHRACARDVPAPSPWWSCSAPDGWYDGPGTYGVTVRLDDHSIQGEIVLDGTEAAHNGSDRTLWAEMDNGAIGRVERRTEAGWSAYPQMAMCGFGISTESIPPASTVISTEGRFRGRPDPLPPGEYRYVVPLQSSSTGPELFEIAAPFTIWEPGKGAPPLERLPPIAWLAATQPEGPAD